MPDHWFAAVLSAQPGLELAVTRLRADVAPSRSDELRLLAYALRATERATPFGALSIVAAGRLGGPGDLRLSDIVAATVRTDVPEPLSVAQLDESSPLEFCLSLLRHESELELSLHERFRTAPQVTWGQLSRWLAESEADDEARSTLLDSLLARRVLTLAGQDRHEVRQSVGATSSRPGAPVADLSYSAGHVRVPGRLSAAMADAAHAMYLLSADWSMSPELTAFHALFLERYDLDRLVSLETLLHPTWGLGAPAGYLDPVSGHRQSTAVWASTNIAAQSGGVFSQSSELTARIALAAWSADTEVAITDEDLSRLETLGNTPPPPVDLIFEILHEGVDNDSPALALSRHPGIPGVQRGYDRFRALLNGRGSFIRPEMFAQWEASGVEPVTVGYIPTDPRLLDIAVTPGVCRRTVDFGLGIPYATRIAPRDVLIGANIAHWEVFDRRTRRRLLPLAPSAVIPRNAPNAARFLIEAGLSTFRHWAPLLVPPGLEDAPYLPRLVRPGVILARRSWRVPVALASSSSDAEADRIIEEWRAAIDVPDRVTVGEHDRVLTIDLDDGVARRLLVRELKRLGATRVTEHLNREPVVTTTRGRHYAELLVSAVPETSPRTLRASDAGFATVDIHERDRTYLPFDEHVSIKIYGPMAGQNALLRRLDTASLDAVAPGQWFFLHYRDPRTHLRLRVCGQRDGDIVEQLWEQVTHAQHMGWVSDAVIDTYAPELERYGGPEHLARAHQVFHADSIDSISLLRSARPGSEDFQLGSIGAVLTTLRAFDVPSDAPEFAQARRVRFDSTLHRLTGAASKLLADLADDADPRQGLRSSLEVYYRALGTRHGGGPTRASIAASLTHMQLNRRLGINPATEISLLAVALRLRHGDGRR